MVKEKLGQQEEMVTVSEEAPRSVSFWVYPIIIFVLPLLILLHLSRGP